MTRTTKSGAKVRLMVIEAEGRHERAAASRHHVKVVLPPRFRDRPQVEVMVTDEKQVGEE